MNGDPKKKSLQKMKIHFEMNWKQFRERKRIKTSLKTHEKKINTNLYISFIHIPRTEQY